eukprot:4433731-Prymnesium_polylepis.1
MGEAFTMLIGGILPFGAVFIELFFIMSSIWLQRFYYVFGFLALVVCILILTCAQISIVLAYFQARPRLLPHPFPRRAGPPPGAQLAPPPRASPSRVPLARPPRACASVARGGSSPSASHLLPSLPSRRPRAAVQRGLPLVVALLPQLGLGGALLARLLVRLLLHAARHGRLRAVHGLLRLHVHRLAALQRHHRHHRFPRLLVVCAQDIRGCQGGLESGEPRRPRRDWELSPSLPSRSLPGGAARGWLAPCAAATGRA